jgi:biphenyl-2,3-diol 1,2-dioxygenase
VVLRHAGWFRRPAVRRSPRGCLVTPDRGQPARVASLGYVGIGVSDLTAWRRFLTGVLGLQWGDELADGSRLIRMDEHRQRLVLSPDGGDDVAFVGWEVSDVDILDAMERHLRELGVLVSRGSRDLAAARGVEALLTLSDPDGLALEIYARPSICWQTPFAPSQPISGFKTQGLGMGHVVVRVADLARSEAFYRAALGFRPTDYIRFELAPGVTTTAAFLRCNRRHHSIAMLAAPLPKRLLHFMVEVHTLDEVGLAFDRAEASAARIVAKLGRHTNDRMLSFYVESPSGFEVEYGCLGRLIDDQTWSVVVHDKTEIWGHKREIV